MLRKPLLVIALVTALAIGGTPSAYAGASLESTPMYRFYNYRIGSHFFTSDATERDIIIATLGNTYQYEGVAYNLAAPGQVSAYVAECVTALQSQIDTLASRVSTGESGLGDLTTRVEDLEASTGSGSAGKPYRWAAFCFRDNANSLPFAGNDATLFGGVTPADWQSLQVRATDLSSDKAVLRTLFTNKGVGDANALVLSETWISGDPLYSGRHAAALFRVRNTTDAPIDWVVSAYMTGCNRQPRSVAINGVASSYISGTAYASNCATQVTLSVPPGRTSTVIFLASADPGFQIATGVYKREILLGFHSNCLVLPAGLEFVDDFDTATGGWDQ